MYEYEKQKLKSQLGEDLYSILKSYRCILAGGAITSLFTQNEVNDYDIYFRDKQDLFDLLINDFEGQFVLSHTDKALLFKYDGRLNIQLIYFNYFDSAEDIFKSFDFTACMGAYDFSSDEFVLHTDFLLHNSQRRLMFNTGTAFPLISALRVAKYKSKGYSISKTEFLRIMLTISTLQINSYEELVSQIGGMYGERYDTLIEKTEEFNLLDAIESLSHLQLNENEALKTCEYDIDDWQSFVCKITGVNLKVVKHNNNTYIVYKNGEIETICLNENNENLCEVVPLNEAMQFPFYYYKYVNNNCKSNVKFSSFYDNSFKYELGQTIIPNSPSLAGIFCSPYSCVDNTTYASRKSATLIKLRVESSDDIAWNFMPTSEIQLKKCVFEEVVRLGEPYGDNGLFI